MKIKEVLSTPGGMAGIVLSGVFVLWLIENGILQSQMATKPYVQAQDQKIIIQLVEQDGKRKAQLDIIESQGLERQLTDMANARCKEGETRYDSIWNDLRRRFEAKRGQAYVFKDCAR